jgi:hypothetical protein
MAPANRVRVGLKYRWDGHVNPVPGDRAVAVTSGSRIERRRSQPSETITTGPTAARSPRTRGIDVATKSKTGEHYSRPMRPIRGVGKCRDRAAEVLGHNGCDRQCPCQLQVHHDSAQVGESVGCADGQHGGSELVADELPARRGRRPDGARGSRVIRPSSCERMSWPRIADRQPAQSISTVAAVRRRSC